MDFISVRRLKGERMTIEFGVYTDFRIAAFGIAFGERDFEDGIKRRNFFIELDLFFWCFEMRIFW